MFRYRRGAPLNVLILLCSMSFVLYVDRVNLATAAGPMQKELGFSNVELGFALSAFAYTYAVFQIVGGRIADRFGARFTLVACGLIWVASSIGTGFVTGLLSLVVMRMLLGIGEGATLPAAARALRDWTPQAQRGLAQGITHSFSRLGNAVTPPIVAFLMLAFSWRVAFVALGLVTIVWVVVWAVYFRDDPRTHPGITQADLAELPPRAIDTGAPAPPVPWGPIARRMSPTIFVYFCQGWTNWLFFTWLPTFFLHGFGLDITHTAIFSSGVFLGGVVGDFSGGVVSDWILRRTGNVEAARRNVIVFSLLATVIFLLPILFSRDLYVVATCLGLAFFSVELTIGPIWAVPMDISPGHVGLASGMMNAGSAVAGILSPVIFGFVIDWTQNWTLPFAGSIAILVAGAVVAFWIKPQRPVIEESLTPAMRTDALGSP
jgi:MFS family permease